MRGSQHTQSHSPIALGIIPAYAGPTPAPAYISRTSGDHPRVCGAHSMTSPLANASVGSSPRMQGSRKLDNGVSATEGSSPRMRGSPEHGRLQSGHAGIIPAYAGLTHLQLVFCRCIWNHPRVCEAHESTSAGVTRSLGSSPRMRGSRSQTAAQRQRPGIIPAHAGLTVLCPGPESHPWDHPRACGTHISQKGL